MATGAAPEPPLEELLLANLRTGTSLAGALHLKLCEIIGVLVAEPRRDEQARALVRALLRLQEEGAPSSVASEVADQDGRVADDIAIGILNKSFPDPNGTGDNRAPSENTSANPILAALDDGAEADADQSAPPAPERGIEEIASDGLRELWTELRGDPVLWRYSEVYGASPTGEAEVVIDWLWTRIVLISLRLPRERAAQILQRAAGVTADLPERLRAGLIPGSLDCPPDDDTAELAELAEHARQLTRWPALGDTIRWLSWLAWHDEGISAASPDVAAQGISPVENYRGKIMNDLRYKLIQVNDAEADSEQEAYCLARLDMALRGLLPLPLPGTRSWWADRLDESERVLKEHAKHEAAVRVLPLNLASDREWENNFDRQNVLRIKAADTADGQAKAGARVWILSYPVRVPGSSDKNAWQKGRYIAVE